MFTSDKQNLLNFFHVREPIESNQIHKFKMQINCVHFLVYAW